MKFYLGSHLPAWLQRIDVPLFYSDRILKRRKSPFPPALGRWALDSGGFSELSMFGRWTTTPEEYVERVHRYTEELGGLDWAAPQDWMVEPEMVAKTGLSVEEHQRRTVESVLTLRQMEPELPFIPVLQGWTLDDYEECILRYIDAGIDLFEEPVVGVGSVCRRQGTEDIERVITRIAGYGISLHGFGVKVEGIGRYGRLLYSSDSMAWSFIARARKILLPECREEGRHKRCNNCERFALRWRDEVLEKIAKGSNEEQAA